jgi:hypothetical protein
MPTVRQVKSWAFFPRWNFCPYLSCHHTHLESSVASVSHLSLKDLRHTRFIFTRQNITVASSHMSESHTHHIFPGVVSHISNCSMTACNYEIGRRTTTQQSTNKWRRGCGGSGGGGSATALSPRRATAAARWQQRGSSDGGGSAKTRLRRQLGSGKAVAAVQQRDVGGSLAAALRRRQRQRRWRQREAHRRRTARRWQRGGSSAVAAAVAAERHRDVGGSLPLCVEERVEAATSERSDVLGV